MPVEHRRWVTTSNAPERRIRELRRRTDPMHTFVGLDHLRRAIYLAIRKISSQRREQVPLAVWSSGRGDGPPPGKPRVAVNLDTQRAEFFDDMIRNPGKAPSGYYTAHGTLSPAVFR